MYKARHPEETVVEIGFGKGGDMVNSIYEKVKASNEPRVIFVDCSRFMADKANLGVIEQIKNGRLLNHKYHTGTYVFRNSPHVVLFTNQDMNWEQMSSDRWRIWQLVPADAQVRQFSIDQKTGSKSAKLWKDCSYVIKSVHQHMKSESPWHDPQSSVQSRNEWDAMVENAQTINKRGHDGPILPGDMFKRRKLYSD